MLEFVDIAYGKSVVIPSSADARRLGCTNVQSLPIVSERRELKSLVLVIGAGASKEVNLPIGAELKSEIARLLDISFQRVSTQESGDCQITDALRLIASRAQGKTGNIKPLLEMCWRIRDAMPQAISIDNFIDSQSGRPLEFRLFLQCRVEEIGYTKAGRKQIKSNR